MPISARGASDAPCQELGTETRLALVSPCGPTCPSHRLREPPSSWSLGPSHTLSTCSHHAWLASRSQRILTVPISWPSGNVTVGLPDGFPRTEVRPGLARRDPLSPIPRLAHAALHEW